MNNQLNDYIEKMKSFTISNCEMTHELIAREENSIMPLPGPTPSDSLYQRGNVCERAKRDHLGCAHTTLRMHMFDTVKDIIKEYPSFEDAGNRFILDVRKVELEIIDIDSKRQDVELAHANISKEIALLAENSEKELTKLQEQLEQVENNRADLITQHNSKNDNIKVLKDNLLESLSQLEVCK